MKRLCTTIGIVALCLVSLRADVTITQTITIEGSMAGAMGSDKPTITTRIKGNKSRADVAGGPISVSSITDLDTKQVIILNAADKTAQVMNMASSADKPVMPPSAIDLQYKATGAKRTIEGVSCGDHTFAMTIDMAQMGASGQMPPEAAEMMKGVKMVANGVTCVATEGKGVPEFIAFQKAAIQAGLLSAVMGTPPSGKPGGGMEKLMAAAASAPGLPYVTEITMTFEGTGPMVDMMKQMGGMKIIQTTTAVSTDALGDDLFKVPADYKVTEKK